MTGGIPPTIEWRDGAVVMIDQRRLPGELQMLECRSVDEVCEAIRTMAVRGAPALGAAGAYGVALAAATSPAADVDELLAGLGDAAGRLVATRPTAVNLAWGVGRAVEAANEAANEMAGEAAGQADGQAAGIDAVRRAVAEAAEAVAREDVEANRAIGHHGAALVPDGARILTHCNAGALACVGYGTALGVVRGAVEAGRAVSVWVDETRPVLQGARLTAWELDRLGIPAQLVADTVAGSLMARGEVDLVVVGADRIAANGDVANKIGTYSLAVLARHHGVPFYVAAPGSTIDHTLADGSAIPVEERGPDEVTGFAGVRTAPEGFAARNPAFDITPAALVTAIVTQHGVHHPPFSASLPR